MFLILHGSMRFTRIKLQDAPPLGTDWGGRNRMFCNVLWGYWKADTPKHTPSVLSNPTNWMTPLCCTSFLGKKQVFESVAKPMLGLRQGHPPRFWPQVSEVVMEVCHSVGILVESHTTGRTEYRFEFEIAVLLRALWVWCCSSCALYCGRSLS